MFMLLSISETGLFFSLSFFLVVVIESSRFS